MPFRKPRRATRRRKTIRQIVQSVVNTNKNTGFIETAIAGGVDATPATHNLMFSTTGAGDEEKRSSPTIRVMGLRMSGFLALGDSTNLLRMVVYIPKDPDGALSSLNLHGPIDTDTARVLYDRLIALDVSNYHRGKFLFRKSFGKNGLKCVYNDADTQPQQNNIKVTFVSDSGGIPNPTIATDSYVHVYYKNQ